ncbi:MAG: ester cyclase [Chloroflexota bacterium]|nr:ester cyclase [Dehalococcoidia bacterium]MEE3246546.1 ester cyclase [Chloroflexota bacterium]
MSEQNKAVFEKLMSALNAKDMATMESLIADDFVDNDAMPGMAPGRQGMIDMMGMFVGAFPDLNVVVEHWVAEGDLVVGVMTTKGTQTGEFMGMPASGKKFSVREMHMVRVANGKMAEHWGLSNEMSMMQQLGLMPE